MRRKDLDMARGIAILLILIGHSNGLSELAVKYIYSFHVPLFFIISGILLCYKDGTEKNWKDIGTGWLKHIIIPSVIWEIILSLFYYIIKGIPIRELVVNSITLNFNLSVIWFIPCLLVAETIWILIVKLCKKQNTVKVCMITAIMFALTAKYMPVLFFRRAMIAVVFVTIGYCVEFLRKQSDKCAYMETTVLLAIAVIWFLITGIHIRVDLSAGVLGKEYLYYIQSVAGSFMVIQICGNIKRNLPALIWVGKNTLGFLVTHVFVRHAIIVVEEKFLGYFLGGWMLAIPMIAIDTVVVLFINYFMPELFGKKRLKK